MRMRFWLMFFAAELFVLPGTGAQEYTLKVSDTIPVQTYGSEPYISPIADFDGDGFKDFVAGVSLYLGSGDGRFLGRRLFEKPVRPTGAGDVDGDVNPDLVVVSPWYTRAVLGSGEPRELQILRNERDAGGKVVFRKIKSWPVTSLPDDTPLDTLLVSPLAKLADIDGDGALDLVALGVRLETWVDPEDNVMRPRLRTYFLVALGDGTGDFGEFSPFLTGHTCEGCLGYGITEFELVDLDGDGLPDIVGVIQDDHGLITVLLNNGEGGFGEPTLYRTIPRGEGGEEPFSPFTDPYSVFPSDLDGDGDLDVVVGYTEPQGIFSILYNRGDGSFDDGIPVFYEPMEVRCHEVPLVAVGDFNGNGLQDAVLVLRHTPGIALFSAFLHPEEQVRTFVLRRDINGERIEQLRMDDFNDDGLADIIVNGDDCEVNTRPCNLVVMLGHLSGEFLRGDANSDGDVDLSDAVSILGYLFEGQEPDGLSGCLDRADADDSGEVSLTDAVYLLNHLFRGGPGIAEPFPHSGQDGTVDRNFCGD